jgi:hypothetical protein
LKDWSCHAGPMVRILFPPGESHVRTWGSRPAARRRRQQRRKPRLALDQRPSAQVSDQVDFRQNAAEDRD